jgi:DNA-binding transcriptional LysR family regulator
MVNLELYRVFYAVAKLGSLTKAAQTLYISQPAVSQSIKQLEGQLGGRLFIRTPKGMELTEAGNVMTEYVEKAINLLNEAENRFGEIKGITVSTVRIGASDTLCKHFLLKYIEEFHKKYPKINLQVYNRTTPETIELLKANKVDLGFVNLPVNDPELNIIEPCMELNDIFVYSEKFMPRLKETVPLKNLEEYPLLMLEMTSNTRRSIVEFTHSLGINLNCEIELGSLDLLIEFAKSGLGVSCVPKEYVLKELKSGELFRLETSPNLPVRGIGLITLKQAPINYVVKEFIDDIRKDNLNK